MIGGYFKIYMFVVLLTFTCTKSAEKPQKPALWKEFRKEVKCGMSEKEFFRHCDSTGWKGIRGTTSRGYRKYKVVDESGDTIDSGNRFGTVLMIGSERDSAKIYVEFSDSTGSYVLNRCWYSKENLNILQANIDKIELLKNLCEE